MNIYHIQEKFWSITSNFIIKQRIPQSRQYSSKLERHLAQFDGSDRQYHRNYEDSTILEDKYQIKGNFFSWGDDLSFQDMNGKELLQMKQELICPLPTYKIFNQDGQLVAIMMKEPSSSFQPNFILEVINKKNNPVHMNDNRTNVNRNNNNTITYYRIEGSVLDREFTFKKYRSNISPRRALLQQHQQEQSSLSSVLSSAVSSVVSPQLGGESSTGVISIDDIITNQNKPVAIVSKKFLTLTKDSYTVQIVDGENDSRILAATIIIGQLLHE